MAIRVEVVRAWPRRVESATVTLDEPATVAAAVAAAGLDGAGAAGYAVFGERAEPATVLRDGDRVELLRPLLADPKETRRRRARRG
ncbi:RnfH family protein [Luteimonas sp. RD2P54]|uniref:UPF0125 protein QFW77_09155 n=1 Tax=Luteimonas endophytica TaxID=3042023 RepID=A0ABT6JAC5_9GAMM|nr:RnfH family protein [Luteimonas endophytica]MDH5823153.1 RnfH family protein [Luteimonas endophytica]